MKKLRNMVLAVLFPAIIIGAATASAKTTKTVKVDCAKGEAISAALKADAEQLIVEIQGVCRESIVLERDSVILRGAALGEAVIESPGPLDEGGDPQIPLTVRNAEDFVFENLILRGGQNVVRVRGSLYDRIPTAPTTGRLLNCRLENSAIHGLVVYDAYLDVTDVTIADSPGVGLIAQRAWVTCERCTLEGSQSWAIYANQGSLVSLANSVVSGGGSNELGVDASNTSRISITDSTILAQRAARAWAYSYVEMWDTGFSGQLSTFDKGMIWLVRVTQNGSSGRPHYVDYDAQLEAFLTTLEDSVDVTRFGKALLEIDTVVNGDLTCGAGGDAWADGSVTITGTLAGCEHAPAP